MNIEQTDEIREVYSKVQYTDEGTGEELDAKKDVVKFMRIGDKGPDEQRVGRPQARCVYQGEYRVSRPRSTADLL